MPALPSELLAVVLAAVEHRETILTLCYVSHMMKHLAEGELLRTVTIDRQSQRYNMATISSYILAPQKEDRRLLVKSLRVINNPIDSHLYQDDINMLDTLIPQLQNLHALFLSFYITPDADVLRFLRMPLPNVQLKQLGIDIEINTANGDESDDGFDAQAQPNHVLDISDFLHSQPRLTYLEYLNDHYIRINDDSLVLPDLRSYAGPLSFFTASRSPTTLCHLRILFPNGGEIASIPDLPSLISLSYPISSPTVLRAFIHKAPNIKCLDTNLDFARHTKTRALVMRSLAKLQHLRIQQGKSITASFVKELFNLSEGQESLRVIEVQGNDANVQQFFRKSLGTSHIADSGGCTDCVEFWLHEQATVVIRRFMDEVSNMDLQSLWDSIPISTMDFE